MNKIKAKLKNIKIKERCKVAYVTTMILLINSIPVFASSNKYARNASDWIMDGVRVIALVVAAAMIGTYILKKKFVQMAVSIFVAAIILSIVYNPEILKNIGDYLTSILFGS